MSSPEDGIQKDEMGCGTVVEARSPIQVGSRACPVFNYQQILGKKTEKPAQVSQLTVAVPGIVGQYQTGEKFT